MTETKNNSDRPNVCMLGYFTYDTDSRVRNYVKFLVKEGYFVDVICLGKKGSNSDEENGSSVSVFAVMDRKDMVKSRIIYLRNLVIFFALSMYKLSLLHLKRRYKFVHIHNIPDFLVFTAWLPKVIGTKVLLDIHDILPELYARKYDINVGSFAFRMLRFVEKVSCKYADYIIVANDIWRDELISRSLPEWKCASITNFPDTSQFSPNGRPLSQNKKGLFKIIYHGSFTEHHGLDVAIKAADILRGEIGPFEFHLYGGGVSELEIRNLTRSMKLEDYVLLKGPVLYRNIPKVLEDADVGIVPKKGGIFAEDALSTKLFEYAAMGIPAVVSRTRAEMRYFNEMEVMYFTPGDPEDMARCIKELYNSPELRHKIAQRALHRVKDYNINIVADKYLNIINSLIK